MPIKVSIEVVALEKKREAILNLPKKMQTALLRVMEEVMRHAVERSRLNAPILTGELRKSLVYERPRITATGTIETAIGSDLPYALRWHEEPFNLGPVSARQPFTPEGGVGNKYITRAVDYRVKKYGEIIMVAVMEAIKKGND
jgi:hypothetical protein